MAIERTVRVMVPQNALKELVHDYVKGDLVAEYIHEDAKRLVRGALARTEIFKKGESYRILFIADETISEDSNHREIKCIVTEKDADGNVVNADTTYIVAEMFVSRSN
jgi:hypothetical protein